MYQYSATITKVLNGDTVTANVDLGFKIKKDFNMRLYGIKAVGEAAKGKLIEYTVGKTIILQTVKSKKLNESDHDFLCVLYLRDDITSINDKLVAGKYATRYAEC